jgi:hypothetical protein
VGSHKCGEPGKEDCLPKQSFPFLCACQSPALPSLHGMGLGSGLSGHFAAPTAAHDRSQMVKYALMVFGPGAKPYGKPTRFM